eukprot:scaffold394363_cov36-Prasinocladus_malaysianus.AAC.1
MDRYHSSKRAFIKAARQQRQRGCLQRHSGRWLLVCRAGLGGWAHCLATFPESPKVRHRVLKVTIWTTEAPTWSVQCHT